MTEGCTSEPERRARNFGWLAEQSDSQRGGRASAALASIFCSQEMTGPKSTKQASVLACRSRSSALCAHEQPKPSSLHKSQSRRSLWTLA